MRGVILLALLTLASFALADQPQQVIDVQHDARRQVTCWIIPGTGISCLPDSQLRQPSSDSNRTSGGANPASTPTPPTDEEVFQL